MKLPRLLFIIAALVSSAIAQTAGVTKSVAPATLNQITGDLVFPAGKTLTVNGTVSGTPAGGTLDLSAVTLTPPSNVVTLTGSQTLTNKTLTSPTLTTPNIGAATGTSVNLSGAGTFGGNLTVSGTSALNGTVNTNGSKAVNVTPTMTPLSGNLYGLYIQPTINSGASAGGTVSGLTVAATNSGTSNVTNIAGIEFIGGNGAASGSMQDLKAFRSSPINLSTGQIVNLYQFYATNAYNPSGTINTQYGLYVDALTSATTNYAIYTAGTAPSVLGGNLTVSGTGTSSFAGVLQFAPDVWQRSGSTDRLYFSSAADRITYLKGGPAAGTGTAVTIRNGADATVASFSGNGDTSVTGNLTVSGGTVDVGTGKIKFTNASQILTGFTAPYVWKVYDNSAGRDVLNFNQTANTLLTGCTFLVGSGATPSGNGAIQLATHTTSAGGIGFGTDTSLYRSAAGAVTVSSDGVSFTTFTPSGTPQQQIYRSGADAQFRLTRGGVRDWDLVGGSTFQIKGDGTTALTLDSSQNATFAGKITNTGELYSSASTFNFYSNSSASIKLATLENIGSNNTRFNIWNNSSPQVYGLQIETSGTTSVGIRARNLALNLSSDNGTTTVTNTTASSSTTTGALVVSGGVGVAGAANIGGAIAIGNTVQTAASVASTHKVTIVIGGVTYYLLATNV